MKHQGLTRRELLERGGMAVVGGLTLAGLTGYAWPGDQAAAATLPAAPEAPAAPDSAPGVLHFVSRPDLTPPALTLTHHGPSAPSDPPYIILSAIGYVHPTRLQATSQGSMQVLPGGRVLIGWGNLPYFSEFTQNGTLIMDGQFPAGDESYRAFTAAWTGQPTDNPAVAARMNPAGGSVVYASWNGATRVSSWTVLAGKTPGALVPAGSAPRHGFETRIAVTSLGPYFAVAANDASGHELARSATVRPGN